VAVVDVVGIAVGADVVLEGVAALADPLESIYIAVRDLKRRARIAAEVEAFLNHLGITRRVLRVHQVRRRQMSYGLAHAVAVAVVNHADPALLDQVVLEVVHITVAELAGMVLDSLAAGNKSPAISKAARDWREMEIIQLASCREKSKTALFVFL